MERIRLINYQGLLLTADTAQALKALAGKLSDAGWRFDLFGPKPNEGNSEGLAPAGREVWMRVSHKDGINRQVCLNALWGHAIPLGFTPWRRYPLAEDDGAHIFHFFGPWQALYDRILSEGRGHLAWPSVCCAAQVDVGVWGGDKKEERFVQAQLHRIGKNCGPIDGIIGPRTVAAIESLGLESSSFAKVLAYVKSASLPALSEQERKLGHFVLPGRITAIGTTGGVKATRTVWGAAVTVDGPGRLVIDIGEEK